MMSQRPRNTSFDKQQPLNPRGESFDATRPRIDSTGLGRPRIDSSVDFGVRLDPPTPDSTHKKKAREATQEHIPHSIGMLSTTSLPPSSFSSASSSSSSATSSDTSSSSSSTSSSLSARQTPPTSGKATKVQIPNSPRAPRLDPTRPLPHQVGLQKKRGAPSEIHPEDGYTGSVVKKMKVNEKESLATAYGKPATVLATATNSHEAMHPPTSAPISLSHFSGTWKLDTVKSETLYS